MTFARSRSQRTGNRSACLAVALVLAGSLAACGPADTGLQRDTAHQLQELVLGVSKAAAAADHAAALKGLDNLEADVASAAGSGHISEERRRNIMTSAAAVRADLAAAIDAAAEAAKAAKAEAAAAAQAAAADKVKADAEAAAKAAQENAAPVLVAPVPAPAPAPAPEQARGNEGKGKENKGKNKND